MSEFIHQIKERVQEALSNLDRARTEGDDFAVQVHTGELESFAHLAREHGVTIAGLQEFRAA